MNSHHSHHNSKTKSPVLSDSSSAKIVYFKSPWTNMGNAFIDIGAMFQLSNAYSQYRVHTIGGGIINILLNYITRERIRKTRKAVPTKAVKMLKKVLSTRYSSFRDSLFGVKYSADSSFELITAIKADYVVLSGVCLSRWFMNLYKDMLLALSEKGQKMIFLGGGAVQYTDDEAKFVSKFLKKIKPYAIITRDAWSFNQFGNLATHSYNGIDAGFFVSDSYGGKNVKLDLPKYVIFTFDKIAEPEIDTDLKIIRLHHALWPIAEIKSLLDGKPNTFISDSPYDYLLLYANTEEVHTDRVHSCVAACSYGTPFRLYYKSHRARLFERIGIDPFEKLVKPDSGKLRSEKSNQMKFLKEIIDEGGHH